jgi:hypothetical protein
LQCSSHGVVGKRDRLVRWHPRAAKGRTPPAAARASPRG